MGHFPDLMGHHFVRVNATDERLDKRTAGITNGADKNLPRVSENVDKKTLSEKFRTADTEKS